jgi:hypothetical protein
MVSKLLLHDTAIHARKTVPILSIKGSMLCKSHTFPQGSDKFVFEGLFRTIY